MLIVAVLLTGTTAVAADVAYDRLKERYEDRLFSACQDNYSRFLDLGEQARAALAERTTDEAREHLMALLAEARKHSGCYQDDGAQRIIRRVEAGLRTGKLVAPPEPRGIA